MHSCPCIQQDLGASLVAAERVTCDVNTTKIVPVLLKIIVPLQINNTFLRYPNTHTCGKGYRK
jgi:hypothetical protein